MTRSKELEKRREEIGVSLSALCRRAGLDYQVCWRGLVSDRLNAEIEQQLDQAMSEIEDEMLATLIGRTPTEESPATLEEILRGAIVRQPAALLELTNQLLAAHGAAGPASAFEATARHTRR